MSNNSSEHDGNERESKQRDRSREKKVDSRSNNKGRPKRKSQSQRGLQSPKDKQFDQIVTHKSQGIMENIIDFLYEIDQQKGFVFNKQQRKYFINKMRQEKKYKIRWRQQFLWDRGEEIKKISEISKRIDQKMDQQPYWDILKDILLESCCLFAQEATGEFYDLLLRIVAIVTRKCESVKELQNQMEETLIRLIQNKDQRYFFLSLQFKKFLKQKKKRAYTLSKQDKLQKYGQFIKKLHQSIIKLQLFT